MFCRSAAFGCGRCRGRLQTGSFRSIPRGTKSAALKGASTKAWAAPPRLDVTRTTLSELVNEKRGISPEMAVRLAKVFGGSAETWLTQQVHCDLAQVHADRIKLKRLELTLGLSL